MAEKILVQPGEDYFVSFLATRGLRITLENPEVIHYFGDSKRKLKNLVAEHDPDLVVIHRKSAFDENYKFPFVLDEISNERDIYITKEIDTNSARLARLHYQRLGLDRMVHDLNEKKDAQKKEKLKINASSVKKIFAAMMWD